MKQKKCYFSSIEEDSALPIDYLLDEMKDRELEQINVWECVRDIGSDYSFCKSFREYIDKSESTCNKKECTEYSPRNGKGGCCKHRGFTYQPSEKEFILTLDGKLTPVLAEGHE
ncbi:MAG: hypothetical protein CVU11_14070 [Bacteroidetes bacterium HGW-Bacteroidetes-6]|jgi:hypothetical protein|nr:MAG: hypothetical protein CVU11_14070 [Bacteroidetes bacterium HGW-Bacteroidetes-6]